jgi:enamine deaminase RidA (YjgF/YER057c/UK114 family)
LLVSAVRVNSLDETMSSSQQLPMKIFWQATMLMVCAVFCAAAEIQCINAHPQMGSSDAVIVSNVVLAHTSQVFPIGKDGAFSKADIAKQTTIALQSLQGVLALAESRLEDAVKLNFYCSSNGVIPQVQKVLASVFAGKTKPAVTFVVTRLPHDAALAVDAVAVAKARARAIGQTGNTEFRVSTLAPDGAIYISGMADQGDVGEATQKTLEKLRGALLFFQSENKEIKFDAQNIIHLKAFLQPMSDWEKAQKAISEFFNGDPPPTVFVEWQSTNPPVEIELIAAAPLRKNVSDTAAFITPSNTVSSPVFSRVARVNSPTRIYISGLSGKSNDSAAQVKEIFTDLGEIAQKAGSDFRHLVKATYYVTDSAGNAALDKIRPTLYDPKRPPAASKARVAGVGEGKSVMLDMIAVPK